MAHIEAANKTPAPITSFIWIDRLENFILYSLPILPLPRLPQYRRRRSTLAGRVILESVRRSASLHGREASESGIGENDAMLLWPRRRAMASQSNYNCVRGSPCHGRLKLGLSTIALVICAMKKGRPRRPFQFAASRYR